MTNFHTVSKGEEDAKNGQGRIDGLDKRMKREKKKGEGGPIGFRRE
jgi:hypothetical protein